jgi:hypothetical protein
MVRDGAGEFARVLREQVAEAADAGRSARTSGDVEASECAAGALADLRRIAGEHGVDVSAAASGLRMYEEDKR